jgi:hypothetical protein
MSETVAWFALHCVLAALALAMNLASRLSSRFRAALSRDRVIALETKDGVAYHFVVSGRSIHGSPGRPARADFTLRFTSSAQALYCLLSPSSVGQVLNGVFDGSIEHEGSLVLLLWFDGRVQQVVPLREPFRRAVRLPGAYIKPRRDIAAGALITREPARAALDADWAEAWQQREKLLLTRVAAGAPHPEF